MEQEERVPEPVSFWGALRGTCCGTEIFSRLRYNSVWRTLWHLLLIRSWSPPESSGEREPGWAG